MHLYIGADHRGFPLKQRLIGWLRQEGHKVIDCGNDHLDPDDDYPDYAFAVADKVVQSRDSLGIICCGSGGGVVFAANKVNGIRAIPATNVLDVAHNREHNNANILGIGTDHSTISDVKKMIRSFITTKFDPKERFLRRIQKITDREERKGAANHD